MEDLAIVAAMSKEEARGKAETGVTAEEMAMLREMRKAAAGGKGKGAAGIASLAVALSKLGLSDTDVALLAKLVEWMAKNGVGCDELWALRNAADAAGAAGVDKAGRDALNR